MTVALEIAVQDAVGYRIAAEAGAQRIELCAGLAATGGLTPSAGLLGTVLGERGFLRGAGRPAPEVHVLVRTRPGGFEYAEHEAEVLVRDVRMIRSAGADGVVVGGLTTDGQVDRALLARLVEAADGIDVTFHRAIDTVADPLAALDQLVEAGVRRVLTSGGAPRAIEGADRLAALVEHAAGRIQVMAGGGVRPEDIPPLVALGVDAVHLSASRAVQADGGPGGGGDAGYTVTDPALVSAAALALRG
ncbi:copper homeostasis protein CutC [Cellulomonas denverensis]|uniref:PF03932 family protein CutC n=1 Tax=Cellulomonas denverensis TaxID=264297 RepID=A0A7X6R0W7_9CELL|nr:copper homeostasis protein CutC [Cellulomonas denverensis]NKY24566.1 copper homeostasis protein CutC [Cellulomonas denverensis]GIG27081.1 copper homeostasis protein CutC [Cellulomonas denverensis]